MSRDPAAATAAALRDHRRRQLEERLALGDLYADSDRVFTYGDGQAIHPARLSTWFAKHRDTLGLPKIPLHGLRHTHAALLIATGGHPKLVQERLGHHSAAFTLDVYGHLQPGLQREAAERVARLLDAEPPVADPVADGPDLGLA